MSEKIPKKLLIRGGLFNSAHPGNGLFFDHAELEKMGEQVPGKAFVRNHDRGVEAAAGIMTDYKVKRVKVQQNIKAENEDGSTEELGRKRVRATYIRFEAELSDDWPAYNEVAQSILARAKRGMAPNTSMAVFGTGISYDKETDTFHFEGPYTLIHNGHVDMGAQQPDQGVGIDEVHILSENSGEGEPVPVVEFTRHSAGVHVANLDDLVADFVMEFADQPDIIEKLGQSLGRDLEPTEEDLGAAGDAAEFSNSTSTVEADATNASGKWIHTAATTDGTTVDLNVNVDTTQLDAALDKARELNTLLQDVTLSEHAAEDDEEVEMEVDVLVSRGSAYKVRSVARTDSSPSNKGAGQLAAEQRANRSEVNDVTNKTALDQTADGTPAPEEGAEMANSDEAVASLQKEVENLRAEMERMRQREAQLEAREVEALRHRLTAEFGIAKETLDLFTTKDQLEALAKHEEARTWNPLAAEAEVAENTKVDEETEQHRKDWRKAQLEAVGLIPEDL